MMEQVEAQEDGAGCVGRGSNKDSEKLMVRSGDQR